MSDDSNPIAIFQRRTLAATILMILLVATGNGIADDKDALMADFKRFDRDDSGYLSKAEMAACGCASFDANEDQILMPAEYLQGRRAASAPQPPPKEAGAPIRRTKAEFERFDKDASGYLSRAEARECGCEAFDANGDLIIMPAEFVAAEQEKAAPKASPAPAPRPNPARTTPGARRTPGPSGEWKSGDTALAGCYGNMKSGVVDRVEGSRAWVRFADEPNCDGFRDLTSLRPVPKAATQPSSGQSSTGGAPPSGTYVCQKISGSSLIGLGDLVIRGETYSGIGGGGFAPFKLSGNGELTWTKGIAGLPDGWTVTSSSYAGLDYLGRPLIKIGYRTSRGSTDLIDCVRE